MCILFHLFLRSTIIFSMTREIVYISCWHLVSYLIRSLDLACTEWIKVPREVIAWCLRTKCLIIKYLHIGWRKLESWLFFVFIVKLSIFFFIRYMWRTFACDHWFGAMCFQAWILITLSFSRGAFVICFYFLFSRVWCLLRFLRVINYHRFFRHFFNQTRLLHSRQVEIRHVRTCFNFISVFSYHSLNFRLFLNCWFLFMLRFFFYSLFRESHHALCERYDFSFFQGCLVSLRNRRLETWLNWIEKVLSTFWREIIWLWESSPCIIISESEIGRALIA